MKSEYRYLGLGPLSRLALSAGLYAAGAALGLALPGTRAPGIALAVAGWIPLMLKSATNKPDDQGLEEWRPVTMAEVDRLDDGLRESRALRKKTRSAAAGLALGAGIPVFLVAWAVAAITERGDASFVLAFAAVYLVPALFFGRIRVFIPGTIDLKMPCFRAVLAERLPPGVALAPYFRFDKDKAGADVPEDIRLMLELKRPPADFVGIQLQAAVNKGPNGEVPYLYAVVLTRGKDGPSYDVARRLRSRGFEVEAGGDGDYGTVVLRQETSGGGYATDAGDCSRLLKLCLQALERLGAAA